MSPRAASLQRDDAAVRAALLLVEPALAPAGVGRAALTGGLLRYGIERAFDDGVDAGRLDMLLAELVASEQAMRDTVANHPDTIAVAKALGLSATEVARTSIRRVRDERLPAQPAGFWSRLRRMVR